MTRLHNRIDALAQGWQGLLSNIFDPYQPERHYMRGPGPKWREKHQPGSEPIN